MQLPAVRGKIGEDAMPVQALAALLIALRVKLGRRADAKYRCQRRSVSVATPRQDHP